ncbi:MAG: hypothetical protein KKA65_00385 [Nanoarchaeota archaeon]|nr:hypothetical protein [Nanoarchaeota archaeon]MBU4351846.1 hypothetical protein [Nanoarchaeota archaeon]MBU4455939.1 hypothetical protein [Nanoarchaeota archaeon]
MKELEKITVKDLIEFYELYVSETNDIKLIEEKAEEIYNEYMPGSIMLNKEINSAVGPLISIYVNNIGINPPTKEEAKEILEKLKKLQKELER